MPSRVNNMPEFRGTAGKMLRGNNVYNAGGTTPNPWGRNGNLQNAAKKALKRRARVASGDIRTGLPKTKLGAKRNELNTRPERRMFNV